MILTCNFDFQRILQLQPGQAILFFSDFLSNTSRGGWGGGGVTALPAQGGLRVAVHAGSARPGQPARQLQCVAGKENEAGDDASQRPHVTAVAALLNAASSAIAEVGGADFGGETERRIAQALNEQVT